MSLYLSLSGCAFFISIPYDYGDDLNHCNYDFGQSFKKAKDRNTEFMLDVAKRYETGNGIERDVCKAHFWYTLFVEYKKPISKYDSVHYFILEIFSAKINGLETIILENNLNFIKRKNKNVFEKIDYYLYKNF